ncbi:methionine adenosyltransferase 2 subunit beta [Ophiostoma piceae UAMH 11346]|uniref:Methionine adenosyltransferase 2 subunit beta n=1 Tax=Ophiostoma piceae (strain UAMH 11346) TaxID=1262450 RepID=S3BXV2_OPHP1|nr:methionine adenosyltransferase 2 subunit beta [Ophiostoma piceae UAMH 11346]
MPSVLVTGASGFLGRQVVRAFNFADWTVTGTAFSRAGAGLLKVDLESESEIKAALDTAAPDVVVHCAANRFPDKVDQDPEGTRRLNIEASKTLATLCAVRGATLIYISTDYVFPGTKGDAPYEADSPTHPPNYYGESKLDGEKAVLSVYESATKGKGVVLRVPVLYGPAERNAESAVNVLLDTVLKAQAGTEGKMDDWSVRYPTNTEDVSRVLVDVATKYATSTERLPTVLQFSSEHKTTKYEICKLLASVLGGDISALKPDPTGGNVPGGVQRPYDCHLSTKALKEIGIAVHTQDFEAWWRRELKAVRH